MSVEQPAVIGRPRRDAKIAETDVEQPGAVLHREPIAPDLFRQELAFLDPELIVVGGGVGQNLDLLEPDMTAALALLTPLRPTMTAGELGREAVVRGAIAIGIEHARETVFAARRNGRPSQVKPT